MKEVLKLLRDDVAEIRKQKKDYAKRGDKLVV
jgi:hypothetical protein